MDIPFELRERRLSAVRWLAFVRFVFIGVCAAVPITQQGFWKFFHPDRPADLFLLGLLLVLCAYNILYLLVAARIRQLSGFIIIQLVADLLAETGIVYATGGLQNSSYVWLYFATIIAASVMFAGRLGVLFATFSVISVSVVTVAWHFNLNIDVLYYQSWSYVGMETAPGLWGAFIARIIIIGASMLLVGAVGDILVARLSAARIINEEILQNMADGLFVLNREHQITQFNSEAMRLLNLDDTPLIGRTIDEALSAPRLHGLLDIVNTRQRVVRELHVPWEGEQNIPLEIKTSLLKEAGGAYRGQVVILEDMTPRKRMEAMLKNAERLESVSQVAAAIAHEIRNPLASLRGAAQELSGGRGNEEYRREMFQIILDEADRLESIISDFLHYARMRPAQLRPCSLNHVLEDVIRLLRQRPDSAGVQVNLQAESELCVMADPEQLTQLFLNLGINALETRPRAGEILFTGKRQETPLDFDALSGNQMVVLAQVIDNGPGIPPEVAAKIFDPFFTTKEHGTGLGLSIVDRIARAHNSMIRHNRRPGGGAIFSIWLPLVECPPE